MKTEDLIRQGIEQRAARAAGRVSDYSGYSVENRQRKPDPDQGTGRTTKQMQSAPLGAIFVWGNGQLAYPRSLAARAGRKDLKIMGPSFFDIRTSQWRGITKAIVVDHGAVDLFDKMQFAGYQAFLDRPAPPRAAADVTG
jgi:hypothetical protein